MNYHFLLMLHASTVLISLSLFLLRSYWLLNDSAQMRSRWMRVFPHVNDTLLIMAAVGMIVLARLTPTAHPWIIAKVLGLLAYIGLGMIALHGERSRRTRIAAMLAALAVFAYLVSVAVSKQVLPGLSR